MGGVLSGFFGGLVRHAGRAALGIPGARRVSPRKAFVATGVVLACVIDLARLSIYSAKMSFEGVDLKLRLLAAAVLAAFAGAVVGNRYLRKMTMPGIQRFVAALLVVVALGLMSGLL